MSVKILVADDHALVRKGVRALLADEKVSIVAEATNGRQAVEMAVEYQPDIAIIDISMRELNGVEAIAQIRKRSPNTAMIALSMFGDELYVTRAVKAGARAYVLKDSSSEDLLDAIRAVQSGQSFFSPSVAKVMLEAYSRGLEGVTADEKYDLLTEREREIYQMLAEGKTNKVIAEQLALKMHTVETHRLRIMNKMDVHNMAELVLSAVRRGIVR